jgi:hypothetical protein
LLLLLPLPGLLLLPPPGLLLLLLPPAAGTEGRPGMNDARLDAVGCRVVPPLIGSGTTGRGDCTDVLVFSPSPIVTTRLVKPQPEWMSASTSLLLWPM